MGMNSEFSRPTRSCTPSGKPRIARPEPEIRVAKSSSGLHRQDTGMLKCAQACVEVCVNRHPGKVVIIEARALETLVIHLEAERFDQMQRRPGIGAQANGIAGIRRNLWFVQKNVKHLRAANAPLSRPRLPR